MMGCWRGVEIEVTGWVWGNVVVGVLICGSDMVRIDWLFEGYCYR